MSTKYLTDFYNIDFIFYVKNLSPDAKFLYILLLNRYFYYKKNDIKDDNGICYIIFKRTEMRKFLNCSSVKISSLIKELKNSNLIEERKRGLGKPNFIYLLSIPKNIKYYEDIDINNIEKFEINDFTVEKTEQERLEKERLMFEEYLENIFI